MAASGLFQRRFGVLALMTSLLTGCVSPTGGPVPGLTRRASDVTIQGSSLAATDVSPGFWGRFKSWTPDDKPKLKNPGKLHLAYARWQEHLGNLVEARESYELALGDNPKSVDAILGLARVDQLNGRTDQAEQRYQSALKMNPDNANVLEAVGQFYASGERWDRAIDMLKQSMLASPQDTTRRYNLAVVLARSGRIAEALPHFSQSVGDAEAHYNIGYILYEQGDLARAEKQFLQAVLRRPDLAQAQQMLDEVRKSQLEQQMFAGHRPPAGQNNAQTASRTDAAYHRPVGMSGLTQNERRWGGPEAAGQRGSLANPTLAGQRPAGAQSAAQATLPAWHTLSTFENGYDHSATKTGHNVERWSNPPTKTPASPGSTPGASGRQRPTPEQLEQWRNQLPRGNAPTGN